MNVMKNHYTCFNSRWKITFIPYKKNKRKKPSLLRTTGKQIFTCFYVMLFIFIIVILMLESTEVLPVMLKRSVLRHVKFTKSRNNGMKTALSQEKYTLNLVQSSKLT